MKNNLNYQTAIGVMQFVASQGRKDYLDVMGISTEDWDLLTRPAPWVSPERSRACAVFGNVCSGTLTVLGIPVFSLPAEYVAAVIMVFVHPINVAVACRFMERPSTAESLARNVYDGCTAEQLFALVCMMYGAPERSAARALFEKSTRLKLEKVVNSGGKEEI